MKKKAPLPVSCRVCGCTPNHSGDGSPVVPYRAIPPSQRVKDSRAVPPSSKLLALKVLREDLAVLIDSNTVRGDRSTLDTDSRNAVKRHEAAIKELETILAVARQ